ncbi:MAG: bifunctional UDP-N-acetylglucosamine diphosphorylase/glucosamine-1-phosphate N-acetyltransferase GlmU [Ktedonobacteraceae bacterium]
MNTYAAVVLAAGKGTRMRSMLPKMLHPLAGLPLLAHVLNAVEAIPTTPAFAELTPVLSPHRPIAVVGYRADLIEATFGERCLYAIQEKQLGTGHAVLAARKAVASLDPAPQTVLVCYGDTPLIRSEVLALVVAEHYRQQATMSFLTAQADATSDFGRIVRDVQGRVREIVEVKRATDEQKRITEVNVGVYCFDQAWLWANLEQMPRNAAGEYYLTDLIAVASSQERAIATVTGSLDETVGINDRVQLAAAEQVIRRRILEQHMYSGVTIVDPQTTYIDADVIIGLDSVILPGTMITGHTRIGDECRIGPYTTIERSVIGDRCIIRNSALEDATLEDDVTMGPFSHCRPGAYLAHHVRMGNFAEVKNSRVGAETDVHHFSYLGDATIGEHVNIGAGTITANYDGVRKNPTAIGDHASIGSDTMLVAPVTVGEYAKTGAGAVVTQDIPPYALVAGVPARLLRMLSPVEQISEKSDEKE